MVEIKELRSEMKGMVKVRELAVASNASKAAYKEGVVPTAKEGQLASSF